MRTALLLAPLFLIACEAASNDGADVPDVPAGQQTPVLPGGQPTNDAPAGSSQAPPPPAPKPITVDGNTAAATRVIVVDANGKRTEATSGDDGRFRIANVMTPYDIAAPDLANPVAFLGATRPDPIVPTGRARTISVPVDVHLPQCTAASCTVTVTTTSKHGSGGWSGSYQANLVANQWSVQASHTLKDFDGEEDLDVNLVVVSSDMQHVWHAHATALGALAAYDMHPTAVGWIGTTTVSAQNLPAGVSAPGMNTGIAFGRRARITLASATAMASSTHIPDIPGAEFFVDDVAARFVDGQKTGVGALKYVPLATTTVDIDHTVEFEPVRPLPRETIASDAAVEWKKTHAGASQVYMNSGLNGGAQVVITNETTLTKDRLSRLGLPYLPVGAATSFTIRTANDLTVDSALAGLPIEYPTCPWLSVFFQTQ